MKTSEAFRRAKNYLRGNGQNGVTHICSALDRVERHARHFFVAYQALPPTVDAVDRAKGVIRERLGDSNTLSSWLFRKLHDVPADAPAIGVSAFVDRNDAALQAHRHAWLDMLIAEFEAKGD